jgi:hypothetical protein
MERLCAGRLRRLMSRLRRPREAGDGAASAPLSTACFGPLGERGEVALRGFVGREDASAGGPGPQPSSRRGNQPLG